MQASETAAIPISGSPSTATSTKAVLLGGAIVAIVLLLVALFVQILDRQPPPTPTPPVAAQRQESEQRQSSASVEPPAIASIPTPSLPPLGAVPELQAREFRQSIDTAGQTAKFAASSAAVREAAMAATAAAKGMVVADPIRPEGSQPGIDPVIWNYWLARPTPATAKSAFGARPLPQAGEIELQSLNRLTLRLSTVDLGTIAPVASIKPSVALTSTLKTAIADVSRKQLALDVFVTPSDEQRLRIPQAVRRQSMTIDLERLRAMPPGLRENPGPAWTDQLIREATVAEFGFDFRILVAGTHQVGVAIVDALSAVPVQSMVINLSTGKAWPDSVAVDTSAQGFFHPGSLPVDLSLILQALEGKADGSLYRRLTARLLYRRAGADATPNASGYDEIEWTSQQDIEALKQATENFTSIVGSSKNADALLSLGHKFARPLFDPDPAPGRELEQDEIVNRDRAAKARQIIVDTANDPKAKLPPTMLVLIVKEGAQSHYASTMLPIGAMGISKEKDGPPIFLGERFALALRLTDQDLSPSRPCPRDWYVAFPKNVAGVTDNALQTALNGLKPLQQNWRSHIYPQSPTLDELGMWLNKPDKDSADRPYVLTYVGHHQRGQLSLGADAAQGIGASDIRRDFQGSSIAILNACNSAMSEISNGMPIGMLAQRRVAAIVATTSGIDGDLAANYLVCMASVLVTHTEELTIGQTHALATRCLWSRAEGGMFNYKGSALKYVLVGNPFQKICAPAAAPVGVPASMPMAAPQPEAPKGDIS
ncbi:hypothetical protein [Variovorax fucosicus]|uniref:hypothetical protein n=1 Tax=Variovorax fucosicus TaxID=3053517 RepID=UPI0025778D2A|nr:hypothetical protein [Variovorax sp. J22G47]MDM0056906.1 hypothetical protein [Variovorax sp. J22G47]